MYYSNLETQNKDPAKLQFHVKQRSSFNPVDSQNSFREISLTVVIDGVIFNKAEPFRIKWDGYTAIGNIAIMTQVWFHHGFIID